MYKIILCISLYLVEVYMAIGLYSSLILFHRAEVWYIVYAIDMPSLYGNTKSADKEPEAVRCLHGQVRHMCHISVESKEVICRSAMFCLDWAMLLLVLGDALGKHTLDNGSDGQVLLPCDGSDLSYQP